MSSFILRVFVPNRRELLREEELAEEAPGFSNLLRMIG